MDFRNESKFMNWGANQACSRGEERGIPVTRGRAYKPNDNAHIEQRNGDWVRKHAFRYRYESQAKLTLLNEL